MTSIQNKIKENQKKGGNTRVLKGVVISDKMDKTVVVSVSRFVKHSFYGKFFKVNKKYKVHDENNQYKVGDMVEMISTRPFSKDKKFRVIGLLEMHPKGLPDN